MKRFFVKFILMLFILMRAAPVFSTDTFIERSGEGLYIDSDPQYATVYLDGVDRGDTPLSLAQLRPGEYSLRLWKEGYRERTMRIVMHPKSRIELKLDLEAATGTLVPEIAADPASPPGLPFAPALFVDGVASADSAITVRAGWHTVSVSAFGWESASAEVFVGEDQAEKVAFVLKPAAFEALRFAQKRKRFNPGNAGVLGATEVHFEVTAPGSGTVEAYDAAGVLVRAFALGPFAERQQYFSWDGKNGAGDSLPEGAYTLRFTLQSGIPDDAPLVSEYKVAIDRSLEINPFALASSQPGLFFAPAPESLPPGSFQIEAVLAAGRPLLEESWKSLPIGLGFRCGIVKNLELAGAVDIVPRFGEKVALGAGVSAKWAFLRPGASRGFASRLGLAALLGYGWAKYGPVTPFGMGTGLALSAPLSLRLTPPPSFFKFDVLFAPGILWADTAGYPRSPAPRIELSGGLLARYKIFSWGASLRWDWASEKSDKTATGSGPLACAADFRAVLSTFVLSVSGGVWHWRSETGGFFGLGFGLIY